MSAIITLTQTTLQTIFILDASRRCCNNLTQLERKPGREMVSFAMRTDAAVDSVSYQDLWEGCEASALLQSQESKEEPEGFLGAIKMLQKKHMAMKTRML